MMINSLLMVLTLNFYLTCYINKSKNKQMEEEGIFYFFSSCFQREMSKIKNLIEIVHLCHRECGPNIFKIFVVVSFLKKQQAVFA